MADVLKVTTPPTGYDNTTKSRPLSPQDPRVQNMADPSKVTRPDRRNVRSDEDQYALNSESNFEKFAQLIKNTPSLTDTLSELLFLKMGTLVSSGLGEGFAGEISQFMEMLKMTDAELLSFMQDQATSAVKFSGPFFDMLRQVLNDTSSIDLKADILDFLKVFNNASSSQHILNNIINNLQNMSQFMPRSYGNKLMELINQLSMGGRASDQVKNMALLKEEILPFLSSYVSRMHDFGTVRDFISMFTLNLSRYENGSDENFAGAFKNMLGYQTIREKLGALDLKELSDALLNAGKKRGGSELMDRLINIIQKGMSGEAGFENRAVFESILKSFLINESVYMPILHFAIPADINGNLLFSELWVDPDSDKEDREKNSGSRTIKMLIKFDIKDVGYFEMIVMCRDGKVDMQLYYPEALLPMEKMIKSGISDIIEANDLSFNSFMLDKCIRPKSITEVFPKIYERKNTINVKV